MRIGCGYDIHRLVPGKKLIVGGVTVPSAVGPEAHSDGDVLIHAVVDALLGALALGDIGSFFPPSDPAYRGIASSILLKETLRLVRERGAAVVNVDCTVVLESPHVSPFRKQIQESLAGIMELEADLISIKAKTKEGLDAVGRGEAVEAHAVVLVQEKTAP